MKSDRNSFKRKGILVYIDRLGLTDLSGPPEYAERVNGSIDIASGQATFILKNITEGDARFYASRINPMSNDYLSEFDTVKLVVKGG